MIPILWLALSLYALAGLASLALGLHRRDWQLLVAGLLAGSAPLALLTLGRLWGHVPFLDLLLLGTSPLGTVWFAARLIHLRHTKRR